MNETCKPCTQPSMSHPTFDRDGDPTDETLAAIEGWQPDFEDPDGPWAKCIAFCKSAWNMDYGTLRDEIDDEDGLGDSLACFITGGWSANEAVQGAMRRNVMFHAMCWHSSYRGGLTKYIVWREKKT